MSVLGWFGGAGQSLRSKRVVYLFLVLRDGMARTPLPGLGASNAGDRMAARKAWLEGLFRRRLDLGVSVDGLGGVEATGETSFQVFREPWPGACEPGVGCVKTRDSFGMGFKGSQKDNHLESSKFFSCAHPRTFLAGVEVQSSLTTPLLMEPARRFFLHGGFPISLFLLGSEHHLM